MAHVLGPRETSSRSRQKDRLRLDLSRTPEIHDSDSISRVDENDKNAEPVPHGVKGKRAASDNGGPVGKRERKPPEEGQEGDGSSGREHSARTKTTWRSMLSARGTGTPASSNVAGKEEPRSNTGATTTIDNNPGSDAKPERGGRKATAEESSGSKGSQRRRSTSRGILEKSDDSDGGKRSSRHNETATNVAANGVTASGNGRRSHASRRADDLGEESGKEPNARVSGSRGSSSAYDTESMGSSEYSRGDDTRQGGESERQNSTGWRGDRKPQRPGTTNKALADPSVGEATSRGKRRSGRDVVKDGKVTNSNDDSSGRTGFRDSNAVDGHNKRGGSHRPREDDKNQTLSRRSAREETEESSRRSGSVSLGDHGQRVEEGVQEGSHSSSGWWWERENKGKKEQEARAQEERQEVKQEDWGVTCLKRRLQAISCGILVVRNPPT